MNAGYRWTRSFGSYSNEELRSLKFRSVKEINRAVDFIWSDPEFKNLPQGSPDGMTLIVPKEAVSLFRKRKLKFEVSKLAERRK